VSTIILINACRFLIATGIILICIGLTGLLLGLLGVIDLTVFSFGVTAGVRVVGTVAVAGCLLGAIGAFVQEFKNT
jgi:hypothetical protein